MAAALTIWLASGNKHKQQEVAAILAGHTIKLPAEAGIADFNPPETGTGFAENALIKARTLYDMLNAAPATSPPVTGLAVGLAGGPVLADDSGLCVDALDGRPGIYSARYYGKNSWNSDGTFLTDGAVPEKLDDEKRNALLLEELVVHSPEGGQYSSRRCRFVCAMVLYFSPDRYFLVQETLEGEIVPSATEIRGTGGFGYDPIVYLPELGRTVAELSEVEKNCLSHRGKAGRAVARLLAGE